MYALRWLTSKTVRQAAELHGQARKLLNHQRDLLPPESVQAAEAAIQSLRDATHGAASIDEIKSRMATLERDAEKWFKAYPNPSIRENIEVFLVAGAVALAIRTFFFQPMAIPTGSAQPTFWGIEHDDYRGQEEIVFPKGPKKFFERWVLGRKYVHVTAKDDGVLKVIDREPKPVFLWIKKQRFRVGGHTHTVWFPPDQLFHGVNRSGLFPGRRFQKGDDVIKLRVTSGDHLFVNRLTYNFREPRRGETVVFVSYGVKGLIENTHYIKRLVALGGDRVRIGNDRHLVINGERLDANVPGYEMVYGEMGEHPAEDIYSGHANGTIMARHGKRGLGRNFPTEDAEYRVRPDHAMTFGDNTMNSFDSRDWPTVDFPEEKIIGKSGFVFWPITERFGWHRR